MKCRPILFYIFLILSCFSAGAFARQDPERLSLQQAVSIAKENNPMIVEAHKKVQIIESRFKNSKKLANPEMDVDVEKIAHDLEEGGTYGDRNLEGEVRINQPIRTWGKRGLTIKIAQDELIQAKYELESLWLDVARQVKEQYNETLLQQKNIELARDHLERAQRFYEQVNIQFNSGKGRNHELARAKLETANARNSFLEAETNFYVSIGKLNILMGHNVQDEVKLQDNLTLTELKQEMADLLRTALQERSDVLSQNQELSKKEKELMLAKRQRMPDVNLGLFVEREDEIYSAGAGISFEIPFWNQFQEDIKEASLEKEIAQVRLETLKKEVSLDVYASYKNTEMAFRSVQNLEQAIREANELLRILNIDYQAGEATFLAYLEGLTSYKETKKNYLAALVNYNNKVAELEQAVGKTLEEK